jgi:hypothetical protein
MVFEDDWPGVFIRGDNAWAYAHSLKRALEGESNVLDINLLKGLVALLLSCQVSAKNKPMSTQVMNSCEICLSGKEVKRIDWVEDSIEFLKEFCPIRDPE